MQSTWNDPRPALQQHFISFVNAHRQRNALVMPLPADLVGSSIRVMSWNVRLGGDMNWTNTRDLMIALINGVQPDVLCLQESTADLEEQLMRECGFQHRESVEVYRETFKKTEVIKLTAFNTILVRHANQVVPYSKKTWCLERLSTSQVTEVVNKRKVEIVKKESRIMLMVTVHSADVNGPPVMIANVHLDEHGTSQERDNEVLKIRTKLAAEARHVPHQILLGDFNDCIGTQYSSADRLTIIRNDRSRGKPEPHDPFHALSLLHEHSYRELLELNRQQGGKTNLTASLSAVSVWSMRSVDHAFASPTTSIKMHGAYRLFTAASDHLPMIIDFTPIHTEESIGIAAGTGASSSSSSSTSTSARGTSRRGRKRKRGRGGRSTASVAEQDDNMSVASCSTEGTEQGSVDIEQESEQERAAKRTEQEVAEEN